jgi:hypothetical protein
MVDLGKFTAVELENFGATKEEILPIATALLGGDAVITHLNTLCDNKDRAIGFIFHTEDPFPVMEATDLPKYGSVDTLAGFLISNMDEIHVEAPPALECVKGWTLKKIAVGNHESVAATCHYAIRPPSLKRYN